MKRLLWLAAVAALAPTIASAADISGAWKLDVSVNDQKIPVGCNLTQSGSTVGGSCNRTDQAEPPAAVTGSVDGSTVKFGYDIKFQDQALHVAYTGALSSDTAMSGTLEVAGGAGTFTGTK